ncbi:hypothetical protein [Actinoplanes aureus]|uniref:Uncharacterized protein n=1 Tax=Actinoplanes aureus TaxID=2792083 RepID=A0A931CDL2_9ACTN|nr:hypothetical protein [Actinoplanes aureus]MBG0568164.1 hypothetical protein [Actinoplanes aureus]
MIDGSEVSIRAIADLVADCLSERGYAFVEEDKIDALAATLEAFLLTAGIPTNASEVGEPEPRSA